MEELETEAVIKRDRERLTKAREEPARIAATIPANSNRGRPRGSGTMSGEGNGEPQCVRTHLCGKPKEPGHRSESFVRCTPEYLAKNGNKLMRLRGNC